MQIPNIEEVLSHYPEIEGIHQACSVIPPISEVEFEGLVNDIRTNGLAEPVVLSEDDLLVDGRSRLLACFSANCEVRFDKIAVDPWVYSISKNIHRRHLSVGQKAAIGYDLRDRFKEEAKERQRLSKGRGKKGPPNSADLFGEAADQAGKLLGIPAQRIREFASIVEISSELAEEVRRGSISIHKAHETVKHKAHETVKELRTPIKEEEPTSSFEEDDLEEEEQSRSSRPTSSRSRDSSGNHDARTPSQRMGLETVDEPSLPSRSYITLEEWNAFSKAEQHQKIEDAEGDSKFNSQDNESIEWALWSWNPVSGCLHNCPYCYARDIAERFYPQKFIPSLYPSRLKAPRNTPFPKDKAEEWMGHKNVFVCSMADLFGRWVPTEWIEAVLDEVKASPQWNFLFLTKFPIRMAEFKFPKNAWVGTTVDCQARVANAEKAFRKIKASVKWLSLEPLIEPLKFTDLGAFQWIVLGGSSKSNQTPEWHPPRQWVRAIEREAKELGIPYYEKSNLHGRIRGYPGVPVFSEPDQAPESLRYLPSVEDRRNN